jgi:uncharacterized protein involved in exopolysaccharide biosynthesis
MSIDAINIDEQTDHQGLSIATVLRGFKARWKIFVYAVASLWLIGLIYILITPNQYNADVDFSYSDPTASTNPQPPGGLAALAGVVGLGGVRGSSRDVAIATLKSRQLATNFVNKYNLLPLLFPERWDAKKKFWHVTADKVPSPRDGADRLRQILFVNDNSDTNIIRLTLTLADQERVALWANAFVKLGDDVLRRRALNDSQESLAYLEQELPKTNIAEMRLSIANLIEQNLQRITMTQTQSNFAFNVIDPAVRPKEHSWPRRGILAVALGMLGILGAALVSVATDLRRSGHL